MHPGWRSAPVPSAAPGNPHRTSPPLRTSTAVVFVLLSCIVGFVVAAALRPSCSSNRSCPSRPRHLLGGNQVGQNSMLGCTVPCNECTDLSVFLTLFVVFCVFLLRGPRLEQETDQVCRFGFSYFHANRFYCGDSSSRSWPQTGRWW